MRERPLDEFPFECDGSLRDIVVAATDESAWQRAYDFVRARGHDLTFGNSGDDAPLPVPDRPPLDWSREGPIPLLRFDVAGVPICCHFFAVEEIEFDLAPWTVRDEAQAEAVRRFLQGLADVLGQDVLLTDENVHSAVRWRLRPASK